MDCNREEAVRAKDIAERKMQIRDFVGARKFILKAHNLFPNLENVTQMQTVCEVHCSAEAKVNGEMDWYGILQVKPTADEFLIKKQYRKLALLLHPDKNKFVGAEAAFKIIGEAHRTLLDQSKRSLHDMLRRSNAESLQPRQHAKCSRDPPVKNQTQVSSHPVNNSTKPDDLNQQDGQTSASSNAMTFWTMCTYCGVRYQYYIVIMNKQIPCPSCMRTFTAFNVQYVPTGVKSGNSHVPLGIFQPVFAGSRGVKQDNVSGLSSSGSVSDRKGSGCLKNQALNSVLTVNTVLGQKNVSTCKDVKTQNRKSENMRGKKLHGELLVGNQSKEKRGLVAELSDAAVISSKMLNLDTNGSCHIGQSISQKQSLPSERSTDDIVIPKFKRFRKGKTCTLVAQNEEPSSKGLSVGFSHNMEDKNDNDVLSGVSEGTTDHALKRKVSEGTQGSRTEIKKSKSHAEPKSRSIYHPTSKITPASEFCEFKKKRGAKTFAVDQIWSVYDGLDGMPRLYARIKKVLGSQKLQFTWLEHEPTDCNEIELSKLELPVACGSFKNGKSAHTQDHKIFSSLMTWEKGAKRNLYAIYPRKGEIWALFKNHHFRSSFSIENHTLIEYEVAEVLSDDVKGSGISICRLVKIEGFVSLFMRKPDEKATTIQMLHHDILRFSHKIPSYRMTGAEREGIPKGLFEIDSAALPSNLQESLPSIKLETLRVGVVSLDSNCDAFDFKPTEFDENASSCSKTNTVDGRNGQGKENHQTQQPSRVEMMGLPEKYFAEVNSQCAFPAPFKHVNNQPVSQNQEFSEKKQDTHSEVLQKNSVSLNSIPVSDSCDSLMTFEYPDSEFHNFDEIKPRNKFQCGQIWALYSDIDSFPNYYGWIQKVDVEEFTLHVKWLDPCPSLDMEKRWQKEGLPIGCGRFELVNESSIYHTTDVFSHLVQAKQTGFKGQYEINPTAGEVWAVFKNWSSGWANSDLKNCEYVIVEILCPTTHGTEVLVLEKVNGYRTVFKPEGCFKMEIPVSEYLRFSHRIPAFRLSEREVRHRNYWELDPASVPRGFLPADSN